MRVKEESEKVGWKLNIQKMKIMVSGPITSCHTEGEKVEAVTDFIFLGYKITVDSDCSHKKMPAPWQKSYSQYKKQKYHIANKGQSSQSYNFSSSHVWI